MDTCQVVIAGAGPVGSFAAYCLAQNNIEVIVVEANGFCTTDMRASTFHPPTLEMLDSIGVAQPLIDKGLKAPIYRHRDRQTGQYIEFDFSELHDATQYPFRLQCEQFKMAELLTQKLAEHPKADMRFRNRIVHFDQCDDHVDVSVETDFNVNKLRTKYLVGADGANSIIRKWLNLNFEGFTYPEKFLTLSTPAPIDQYIDDLCYVNYVSDPKEWLVLLRVPSAWRILVPAHEEDDVLTSDAYKDALFSRLLQSDDKITTNHRTVYNVHQRVVNKYNNGRVIVIGDAAHLNNPLGGFGMNSGLHDAWSLTSAFDGIFNKGGDADILLDSFDDERRSIMRSFIQAQTIKNKKAMEATSDEAQRAYAKELRNISNNSARRREFLLYQSMLKYPKLANAA